MRRLSVLLIIFSSLLGCSGAPKKPLITLCVMDFPSMEAICAETSGEEFQRAKDLKHGDILLMIIKSGKVRRIPLAAMDKAIMLDPPNWERFSNYLDDLEEYAKHQCGS